MNTNLIILFGSQISGHTNTQSDFDVAILTDHILSLDEKLELSDQLAKQMNVSSDLIDIVDLNVASPLLQYSISKTGRLISGNKDDFLRFKVLAWKRYQDTAKFRQQREKALYNSNL